MALDLVVDEVEHGADLVLARVEVRHRERVLEVLERARVTLELVRHEVRDRVLVRDEVLVRAEDEARDPQRWARRTKPVRKVKRM